jgi:WD40 repeat protein
VTRPLGGGAAPAQWASVSPDGRTLATGSTDGDVRLFDLTTQRQIGAPLPAVPDQPTAPVFTPDGAYLLALSGAGRGYRWDVRPATWERQACAVGGRTLTRAEWADVMPGRPYAPACR